MKSLMISFIIPVYNRPQEIDELLQSFSNLDGQKDFEIVIVEDGSTITSLEVVELFKDTLNISYFFKPNSGPGDSRNYGMRKAKGNYFIVLDSDVILPKYYYTETLKQLNTNYVDCFGGPDAAHQSFSNLQKAINFSMTSFITTGGIRGRKDSIDEFQPRSFNMGISKEAFQDSKGFGKIHPGEDPDLSIRLKQLGYKTRLFSEAYVYHKRRISWSKFYKQVNKFGLARPILNKWHPQTKKITYWFPAIFSLGLILACILLIAFNNFWLISFYGIYFLLAFILALYQSKSIVVASLALPAIFIQFFGYGYGFLLATIKLSLSDKAAEEVLPKLFFK